jgi:hypothetical protein
MTDAQLVVVGTLANAAMNPANDERTAVTDLRIQRVLKAHPIVGDRKVVPINRYIPNPDPKNPPRYLIFCDVTRGKVDPWKGVVASDALVDYVRDAQRLDPKKPGDAVGFFHRHLDSKDADVVRDASLELSEIPYAVLREHAPRLSADAIMARQDKRDTPVWLRDFDGLLLGHCGKERHAAFLEKLIKEGIKHDVPEGFKGILIGYTLLKPKEGLEVLRKILRDEKNSFNHRYATTRALRFFWDDRREVLPPGVIVDCISVLLDQKDIADIAIEELRMHKEVRQLERILALYDRPGFDAPYNRRAIISYALTFKEKPAAERFIEQVRAKNAEVVENCEELLKLEAEAKKQPGR